MIPTFVAHARAIIRPAARDGRSLQGPAADGDLQHVPLRLLRYAKPLKPSHNIHTAGAAYVNWSDFLFLFKISWMGKVADLDSQIAANERWRQILRTKENIPIRAASCFLPRQLFLPQAQQCGLDLSQGGQGSCCWVENFARPACWPSRSCPRSTFQKLANSLHLNRFCVLCSIYGS
jgi:hypothetical protein